MICADAERVEGRADQRWIVGPLRRFQRSLEHRDVGNVDQARGRPGVGGPKLGGGRQIIRRRDLVGDGEHLLQLGQLDVSFEDRREPSRDRHGLGQHRGLRPGSPAAAARSAAARTYW